MIRINRLGYQHVGIHVGPRGFDGRCVLHNSKGQGVVLATLNEFSGGSPIFIQRKATGNFYEREAIAARAMSLLGQKYDLIKFNCEHTASLAQRGVAESPQLVVWGLLAIAAVGVALFSAKKA